MQRERGRGERRGGVTREVKRGGRKKDLWRKKEKRCKERGVGERERRKKEKSKHCKERGVGERVWRKDEGDI